MKRTTEYNQQFFKVSNSRYYISYRHYTAYLAVGDSFAGTRPNKMNADKGDKKALKNHAQKWFKSVDGGQELAAKVFDLGLWPLLEDQILPFINAVREAVALPKISKLP